MQMFSCAWGHVLGAVSHGKGVVSITMTVRAVPMMRRNCRGQSKKGLEPEPND